MTADGHSARVEAYLRAHCFPPLASGARPSFGAELELLAVDAASRRVAPIRGVGTPGTLDVARATAARLGWTECASAKGVPRFAGPTGAALAFEPGGQLEYASAVHRSADALLRELDLVEAVLRSEADARGIELLAVGVDPENGADDAPLQLDAPRYRRMAAHFARIGPDGARMMRQTASLQLCVGGVDVAARYRMANALAPWLVALFANSRRYAGRDTGCASYRAETWRGVEAARTGVLPGDDPVREYAAFALAAPAFLAGAERAEATPFAALAGDVGDDALALHLSTLFPEVRPRGYLELRSLDAVGSARRAEALVLAAGLLAEPRAAAAALELAGDPDPALLRAAGRRGLDEPRLASGARELAAIALDGCRRLGPDVVSGELLERTSDWARLPAGRARREPAAMAGG